ncbi:MAG: glycosyltransferase family 9 protein [Pyrinomonadaceae bacterium]
MKSLRDNLSFGQKVWPALAANAHTTADAPQPLGDARWDWQKVRSVLVVRLRSIGDTVLATPSLHALRRFLPDARIDILLEDWVAPVLDGFEEIDNVITIERGSTTSRARVVRKLRAARYDVAYNLHGGTTATLLMRASGAKHRVGYAAYQYSRLHNHAAPPSAELWRMEKTHSAEQQLALLGWTGVPVTDRPAARLALTEEARNGIEQRLCDAGQDQREPFALIHPAAAFETKQWATENFARVAEHLHERGIKAVAVTAPNEAHVAAELVKSSSAPITAFTDLTLPLVTALASRARIFVGNDSGIAHIASAVGVPSVVIFGSSNVAHWRPWSNPASEVVREEMPCQPCPGYTCAEFDAPECIRRVSVGKVMEAVEKVLSTEC